MKDGSGKFFPLILSHHWFVDDPDMVWFCTDQSQLQIAGNGHTRSQINLNFEVMIKKELCIEKSGVQCEMSPQHEEMFSNVHFMSLQNSQRFDENQFGPGGPIVSESEVVLFHSPATSETKVMRIEETVISLSDNRFIEI